jgi:hypothetical protein
MALTRPKYSQIYDTDWKQSVKLATTADVGDLYTSNAQPNSLDGVSLTINDRVLVKDQGNSKQNGLYFVRSVGTGANGWWARTLDANQDAFVTSGLTVDVTNGSTNSGKQYKLLTSDPIFLGNTNLSFGVLTAQPGGANTYVQFNDNNLIGGVVGFTFDKTSNTVSIGGSLTTFNAGNISAGGYFLGNGSQLTGIASGYSNVQVATYLPTYTGIVTASNVAVNGNVTAQYILGSGQFLTGLPAGYSNVNVKAYTESMGFQNYGNANVTAYTVTMGFTNFSNVNIAAYAQTQSYTNYSNVNVAAYTQTQSFTNYSNVNLAAYLGGVVTIGGNLTVQSNLNVTGNVYSNSGTDPLGYVYTMDDISSQFDGQSRSFTIKVNDGTVYSVKNPNQISLQIGGVTVAPTRYIIDYQNLTEISVFNRGFYLQTGTVAANASIITGNNFSTGGNTIAFATAPSVGMSFYGTVRTNSDPIAAFTFKQSPFTALNIMLGS